MPVKYFSISVTVYLTRYSKWQFSRLPERTSSVQWNCSVPYWPDFQLHLHCNLLSECERGQDEDNCGYVTCRQGGFVFNGICYMVIQPEHALLHYTAQHMCKAVHGQLAIFPLETDREALGQFMYERHKLSVYVGVQVTLSGLPAMYALLTKYMICIRSLYVYAFVMCRQRINERLGRKGIQMETKQEDKRVNAIDVCVTHTHAHTHAQDTIHTRCSQR